MSFRNVGNVRIDDTILRKMTAEAKPRAANIVKRYGFMISSEAIKRAPVDTGNLINTISSNSQMVGEITFRVQDATEYGLRLELGFHDVDSLGRRYNQAARPFMKTALEKYRAKFIAAFAELFK